jgi:hypothetical protein
VTQHFADLIERCALAQHIGGQTVSQQMCAFSSRLHPSFCQSTFHDFANRNSPVEAVQRSMTANEEASAGTSRPGAVNITDDSPCDICGQRKLCPSPFSIDGDQTVLPVNIFKVEPDNFSCPQTEPGKQEKNGVVPSPQCCAPVTMTQDSPHLRRRQVLWKG